MVSLQCMVVRTLCFKELLIILLVMTEEWKAWFFGLWPFQTKNSQIHKLQLGQGWAAHNPDIFLFTVCSVWFFFQITESWLKKQNLMVWFNLYHWVTLWLVWGFCSQNNLLLIKKDFGKMWKLTMFCHNLHF